MNMLSVDEIRKKAESWLGNEFNEETRKEVREMLDSDEKKLIDAFYQDLEFGTGGLTRHYGGRHQQDEYLYSWNGNPGLIKLYY